LLSNFQLVVKNHRECYDIKMIDWSKCAAVERHPEKVSGEWLFRGTRLPISALFENLEEGASPAQFVEWFDGATLEQVRVVLHFVATESSSATA
jgi:uncharacterized protein (DUF433 family)